MVSLRMLNEKGATQVAPLFSSAWRAEPRQLRYMGRVPPPAPDRSLVNGLARLPDTRRLHGRGFTGTVRFAGRRTDEFAQARHRRPGVGDHRLPGRTRASAQPVSGKPANPSIPDQLITGSTSFTRCPNCCSSRRPEPARSRCSAQSSRCKDQLAITFSDCARGVMPSARRIGSSIAP